MAEILIELGRRAGPKDAYRWQGDLPAAQRRRALSALARRIGCHRVFTILRAKTRSLVKQVSSKAHSDIYWLHKHGPCQPCR